ncbi:MAG: hypothetical protein KDB06_04065 [Ilumatobacter sp.]|nr:hypothetical protein [Ilumatobacter sp.]
MEPTLDGPQLPSRSVGAADDRPSGEITVQRPAAGPAPVLRDPHHYDRHHTMIPRTLCFAGQVAWLTMPAVAFMLTRDDRIVWDTDNGVPVLDHEARRVMALIGVASVAAYLLGWVWWTTVAALNARQMSRRTMWPGASIASVAVQAAVLALLPSFRAEDELVDAAVLGVAGLIVVAAHFYVLGALRRTAESINGPTAPWTRLIVIPWAVAAFNAVGAFFVGFISTEFTLGVLGLQVLLLVWYVASTYQAMTSFDRASVGRALLSQDDHTFAMFMRMRHQTGEQPVQA